MTCLHLVKSLRAAGRNSLTMHAAPLQGEHVASTQAMPAHCPVSTNKTIPWMMSGPLTLTRGMFCRGLPNEIPGLPTCDTLGTSREQPLPHPRVQGDLHKTQLTLQPLVCLHCELSRWVVT